MTPDARTRAEKIWNQIPRDLGSERWIEYLAKEISEAEREAVDQFIDRQVLAMEDEPSAKKIYEEGFHAARERAAELSEKTIEQAISCRLSKPQHFYNAIGGITNCIRQLKP